ncbi:MobC [Xenorhabdus stockiae]|uniref:MobC n=1 Tax=Xenorhabdus stockiae TaxID=351614 RepID=UPI004063D379
MNDKNNFYSLDRLNDIENSLNQLPDLSKQRLIKSEALNILKDSIKKLKEEKGYTVSEILEKLKELGMNELTQKDIKSILEVKKRNRKSKTVSNEIIQ